VTFGGAFLPTLIGALVGAVAGALAAWLFALDLRRREGDEAERTRLDAAVAEVVRLLGEFGGAIQAFGFSVRLGSPAVPSASPQVARQQLLSAVLVARMAAGVDEGPLLTTYELITRQDDKSPNRLGISYEHAAHTLVRWRQGHIDSVEASATIVGGVRRRYLHQTWSRSRRLVGVSRDMREPRDPLGETRLSTSRRDAKHYS
jgi:hypothetical protein